MVARFFIEGEPQGKGRPRFATKSGKAYTPGKTIQYERAIRAAYNYSCKGIKFEDKVPLRVDIKAFFKVPESDSKNKTNAKLKGYIRPTKKPDGDNIMKAVCDALNGLAYNDDAQIVECSISKRYAKVPYVYVEISEVEHEQKI